MLLIKGRAETYLLSGAVSASGISYLSERPYKNKEKQLPQGLTIFPKPYIIYLVFVLA